MYRTIEDHFLARAASDNLYAPNTFELTTICRGNDSRNPSTISRLVNCLTRTLNNTLKLPKWIFFIPESDILDSLQHTGYGVSGEYGRLINWLMCQVNNSILDLKRVLPYKSKKNNWPYVIWILPSLHISYNDFELRKKFIRSLRIAAKNYDNMGVISLKQGWNWKDDQIFNKTTQKFKRNGLNILWNSIDRAMRYADTKMIRSHGKTLSEIFQNNIDEEETLVLPEIVQNGHQLNNGHRDRMFDFFRQSHDISHRRHQDSEEGHRRLPPPARKCLNYK